MDFTVSWKDHEGMWRSYSFDRFPRACAHARWLVSQGFSSVSIGSYDVHTHKVTLYDF